MVGVAGWSPGVEPSVGLLVLGSRCGVGLGWCGGSLSRLSLSPSLSLSLSLSLSPSLSLSLSDPRI